MGAAGQLLPQQEHFLKVIMSNTERLGVLVNDLLDISRIETGRIVLNYQAIDLPEIAEDVLDDLERRSREENKPMNFQLDVPEKYPEVNGDSERIRQILYSLVSNGYNYTPANGIVLVKMRFDEDEAQVDVIDNGIGISDEQKPRIFERFFRGEDTLVLETAGTGLGLATSKSLVEMHKGKIWFISTGVKGEGSTFSFTLPLRTAEE
jgi:signal transduction histidine kinase